MVHLWLLGDKIGGLAVVLFEFSYPVGVISSDSVLWCFASCSCVSRKGFLSSPGSLVPWFSFLLIGLVCFCIDLLDLYLLS